MNPHDHTYKNLVRNIYDFGHDKGDRTNTGTRSLFSERMEFFVRDSFPLLTLKHTPFRLVAEELLWFIEGGSNGRMNERDLAARNVHFWKPWASEDGDLGPVYGAQWRSWPMPDGTRHDQLLECQNKLIHNPDDRRIIVSSWNVSELGDMALPPCHLLFQFYSFEVEGQRYLDLQLYQRSCDFALGVPMNYASYTLLLYMMAKTTDHIPNRFIWLGGDCHIYNNHFDGVKEMLQRDPYPAPKLNIKTKRNNIDEYTIDDFELIGYDYHPKISFEVAV